MRLARRIAVRYSQTEPMDWGVPVLFARNPHAALCTPRKLDRGQSVDQAAFKMLFGRRRATRLTHPLRVAVWSMSNSLTYREKLAATLEKMNAAQGEFGFLLKERPIPAYLWTVENSTGYLNADKIGPRLEKIRQDFDVDYLLCVTDLSLRDETTGGLYLWSGEKSSGPGDPDLTRVVFFSIWSLKPPLRGATFSAALANCVAITLAEDLSKVAPLAKEPKFTIGYFNEERDVAHIAGQLRITALQRRRMLAKKKITTEQLAALEKLLVLFQPVSQAA